MQVSGLTWGEWDEPLFDLHPDIILGADVLYDSASELPFYSTVFSLSITVLLLFLKCEWSFCVPSIHWLPTHFHLYCHCFGWLTYHCVHLARFWWSVRDGDLSSRKFFWGGFHNHIPQPQVPTNHFTPLLHLEEVWQAPFLINYLTCWICLRSGHHLIEFLMVKWGLKCLKLLDGFSFLPPCKAASLQGNIQLVEIVLDKEKHKWLEVR